MYIRGFVQTLVDAARRLRVKRAVEERLVALVEDLAALADGVELAGQAAAVGLAGDDVDQVRDRGRGPGDDLDCAGAVVTAVGLQGERAVEADAHAAAVARKQLEVPLVAGLVG